jgi:predicted RNA binding protein YcfA (HicA-like mRNA interferase family)
LGKNDVRVTVPDHKTIAPGTLKSILKQAELGVEDLADKP